MSVSSPWESTLKPVRTVAPVAEPITVAEMRQHCQLADSYTYHDSEFAALIQAAREQWEADTGCVCLQSTWAVKLDNWWSSDDGLQLSHRPVQSISSISYLDTAGASQTWSSSNYTLDLYRVSPTVWYAYNVTTPSLYSVPSNVTVTYVAGYATAAEVPASWKHAIKLLAGHWFSNRDPVVLGTTASEVPHTYERLVQSNMRSTYP